MKKIVVLLIAVALWGTTMAQQKGTVSMGGSFGFAYQSVTNNWNSSFNTYSSSFSLEPSVEYFFSDHCYGGISLGVAISGEESTFGITPYIGYYKRLNNYVCYTLNAGIGYVSYENTGSCGFTLTPCAFRFPGSEKFAAEISLFSLTFIKINNPGIDLVTRSTTIQLGTPVVGFHIYL